VRSRSSRGVECRAQLAAMRMLGCGSASPPTVLSNGDLATLVETNDEWISSRTGIKRRQGLCLKEGGERLVPSFAI